jgi:hypothetical protein
MKSVELEINGVTITAHSDGSITKPFHGKAKRTLGSKNGRGYISVGIGGRSFLVHRIIAQAFLSAFPDYPQVDHIDADKTNNDIVNLRMSTGLYNSHAGQVKRKNCSSKYIGVTWDKKCKRWMAKCMIKYKLKFIGYFDSEREAAVARDAYHYLHGLPKEGLNFPEHYS